MPDFAKRFRKEVTDKIGVTSGKANNGFAEYSLNLEGGNMIAIARKSDYSCSVGKFNLVRKKRV